MLFVAVIRISSSFSLSIYYHQQLVTWYLFLKQPSETSYLKLFFKITQCSLEKSVFKKAAGLTTATLLTETPTKVFFREYCENFEKKYFEEHLRMAASAASWLFLLEWSRVESIYLSILDLHRNRNVIILHFLQ